ncbi:putative hydrolase C777.06c [Selaginella moellendorffii]|nr:putative hydrolase C777.06c [Selaginella moellendorffii]|eukprot:XP_002970963.2 putative hydrolase C777.06c [Selaginella moellendorffii]
MACVAPMPHNIALASPRDRLVRLGALWSAARLASSWWPRLDRRLCAAAIQDRNVAGVNDLSGLPSQQRFFDVIFLGTGTSEGVPRVSCLTNRYKRCPVCFAALQVGNKNRRRNTSIIVRYPRRDGTRMNILVDAGKFFYHSALQWFPYYGLRHLDAVIITHSHADAIGGLDDLRDWTNNIQDSIPIYVAQRDLEVMRKTHYYLLDPTVITEGTQVSKLQFKVIDEQPFFVEDVKVTPLPVWHGPGYRSLGFRIADMCYISDVSEIPEETYALLQNCDLLVVDALRPDRPSTTHFSLDQALDAVKRVHPKRTLFTGMMHTMDHDKVNKQLADLKHSEGLDVQLSFDGQLVQLRL